MKHGDAIVPYQATFATGHKDSIPLFSDKYGKKSFHQEWWGKLNEASPLKKSHPVSLSDLMMDKSDEYFIICASPDYINAINMDLMKGISYLKDVDRQLIIISSSQAKFSLKKNLLVSNKSIAEFFNSNMLMLNIKIAQYVIEQFMSMDDGHLGLLAERLRSTFFSTA
ncbi:tgtA5 cluster protein 2 [Klebsiella pneumoniae IS53]|nr:tgtA5 cluster protein 2 [Klebsiella pneumoniae IS53]